MITLLLFVILLFSACTAENNIIIPQLSVTLADGGSLDGHAINIAEDGCELMVHVESNYSWLAKSNADWLTLSKQGGEGNGSISITASSAEQSRSAAVEIYLSNYNQIRSTFDIIQHVTPKEEQPEDNTDNEGEEKPEDNTGDNEDTPDEDNNNSEEGNDDENQQNPDDDGNKEDTPEEEEEEEEDGEENPDDSSDNKEDNKDENTDENPEDNKDNEENGENGENADDENPDSEDTDDPDVDDNEDADDPDVDDNEDENQPDNKDDKNNEEESDDDVNNNEEDNKDNENSEDSEDNNDDEGTENDDNDTPTPEQPQGAYLMINKLSQLSAGEYYIGGYQGEALHLATTGINGGHCNTTQYTFTDTGDLTPASETEAVIVTLEKAAKNGYYIRFKEGYLTASAAGPGKLVISEEKSEHWIFSTHPDGGFMLHQSGDIDVQLIISPKAKNGSLLRSIAGDEEGNAIILFRKNE